MSKKTSSKKKIWRINVIAAYHENVKPVNYRNTIYALLYNLARLYKLEIAVSYDHLFSDEFGFDTPQNQVQYVEDLFYLRSTDQSHVDRKKFQNLIEDVFHGNGWYYPVEVFCLYQKHNKKFPFPSNFERPLVYPYVEVHKEGQSKLFLHANEVIPILCDEQNWSDN